MKPVIAIMVLLSICLNGGAARVDTVQLGAPREQALQCRGFEQTGNNVCGVFLEYWIGHGGLERQGLPISEEIQETSVLDGKVYTVQYFEKAILEQHPENPPPYDVLIAHLGVFAYKAKHGSGSSPPAPMTADPSCRRFPETGYSACGTILKYWEAQGGLMQYGYPISPVLIERSADGREHRVQYFERSLLAERPENASPDEVVVGEPGAEKYASRYPAPAHVTASISLPFKPVKIEISGGYVWVAGTTGNNDGSLLRVDSRTNAIVGEPQSIGFEPHAIAVGEGGVWITQQEKVARFDPVTGKAIASIPVQVSSNYVDVVAAEGGVWICDPAEEVSTVLKIDPLTNSVTNIRIKVGQEPLFIVAGAGSLWVGSHDSKSISRIDPHTARVTATISAGFEVHGLEYSGNTLWVADYHGHKLHRLDPSTERVIPGGIPVGFSFEQIAAGDGLGWAVPSRYANDEVDGNDKVAVVDTRTNLSAGVVHTNAMPIDAAVGEGAIWIATQDPDKLMRFER